MIARLRSDEGFGLMELLVAMVILNVGILALVAAFQSGALALRRASRITTAATLADAQMERYRSLPYDSLVLDAGTVASTDNTYRCDSVLGTACPNATTDLVTGTCATPLPDTCQATRTAIGADGRSYRVDAYILRTTISEPSLPASRELTKIKIVVREAATPSTMLARETSTFDRSSSG